MKMVHFKFLSSVAQQYGKHSQPEKVYLYFPINTYIGHS